MQEKHKLDELMQTTFIKNLTLMGFDSTGNIWENCLGRNIVKVKGRRESYERFENSVFVLMPYYFGSDSKLSEEPNFIHKKTNTVFTWYQSPARGIKCNVNLSEQEFLAIMEECTNSLKR